MRDSSHVLVVTYTICSSERIASNQKVYKGTYVERLSLLNTQISGGGKLKVEGENPMSYQARSTPDMK